MDADSCEDSELRQDVFQLLVNAVTDYAIYMLDRHGRVVSWNAGAQRFKGYVAAEIVGRHFSCFYTDEDRAAGVPALALKTAATEGKFEAEGWRVRKDGSRFWAHVIIDPIRSASGEVIGYAKITRDLSERREAQLRLDATREQLFQAQKMEALGQLTGGVAHDFNNILAAILGSLQMAQKRVGTDVRLAQMLENAIQAGRRGATLTQRMLAFARRQDLKPEQVDVKALVGGMRDMLDRSLGSYANLFIHFPAAMDSVLVDPGQLEMALLNLAVNARDAMPDGGPITIAGREQRLADDNGLGLPAGRYLALSVQDRGGGMDEATRVRAIEPFYTTKGVGKGTGLGLAMVHGLAEQSGGRFVLDSKPGEGTTATLWLPAAERALVPAKVVTAPAEVGPPAARRLNILAVDDDALVLMNTQAMLEDMGHAVKSAYSAVQALAQLRGGEPFDLLVTDHGMPGMTGAELIETVRREWPALKILLMTGYAELPPGTTVDAPRLAKPFFQTDLARAIQPLL